MKLNDILKLIMENGNGWLVIAISVLTMIEIVPIKINPWGCVFNWLGRQMNKELTKRLDVMEEKLDRHISDSNDDAINATRASILSFGSECMRGVMHTKEEFEFIIAKCDRYEKHCADNNIPNGVATATIEQIKKIYSECLSNNSFADSAHEYNNAS